MGLIKLGETSGHREKEENILAKDSGSSWGPEHFSELWKKKSNFSKWMLRHSLRRANSFKAKDSAGFWRPDSPSLGIASTKKASFPRHGI